MTEYHIVPLPGFRGDHTCEVCGHPVWRVCMLVLTKVGQTHDINSYVFGHRDCLRQKVSEENV